MNPIFLNPWAIAGAGAIAVGLFLGGFFEGDATAADRYKAKIATATAQALEAQQQATQARLIQESNASQGLETGNAKAKVVYRTITQQVDKVVQMPVYLNTCLDDSGLRLANAALGGVLADAAPRQLNKPLSGPNGTE